MKDGAFIQHKVLGTCEVFAPRWWRLDRWALWLLTRRHKGRVTMSKLVLDAHGTRLRYVTVRVLTL